MTRVLHVAALPFPSPQGTQALLHHMLLAHREVGFEPHLLCYAHGDGRSLPYAVHRVADWPRLRTLRSGPTWHKPLLDLRLGALLRELHARLRPDLVIAHHVEAAACAAAILRCDWVFYAHTDVGAELPTYLGARFAPASARAGAALDRWLARRAPRSCAVSGPLAHHLQSVSGATVHCPPLPWPVDPAPTRGERTAARHALGLSSDHEVVLYAGNLDAYQGLEQWLEAFRVLASERHRLTFLLATASDTREVRERLHAWGLIHRVVLCRLDDDTRDRVHAAADIAVVPRRTPGGLPVKLLEALSRGLPVVANRRAVGDLPLDELAWLVDDGAAQLVDGVTEALDLAAERTRRRKLSRAYIATRHTARDWALHPALRPRT